MRKAHTLAACFGVVILLTITASSARADALGAGDMLVKLNNLEEHVLSLPDQSRAGTVLLFSEDFENNNGKHLGFSVASAHRGPRFGLFNPPQSFAAPTSNPEPAAVLLLGTGLAAAGAFARRRFRKSTH